MEAIINKTMDRDDLATPEAGVIAGELNDLVTELKARKLGISSWYGRFNLEGRGRTIEWLNRGYGYRGLDGAVDDVNFPWFLYWEIAWVVMNNEFRPGQRVVDLGGSSSLFSYYLASKGLDVTTVDLQRRLVDNGNEVGREMGWKLNNLAMDMRTMELPGEFDHITSICVYEHIPMFDRVEINKNVRKLLKDGGKFSITFDYRNPSRAARINSPEDVYEQFVKPSGLRVRGNAEFHDNGKNYLLHPFYYNKTLWRYKWASVRIGQFGPLDFFTTKDENDYTFGALFLEK